MRRPRTMRVGVLVVAVLASGLSGVTSSAASAGNAPVPNSRGTYLSGEFNQRTVDRFVADLARVGVGVYDIGTSAPVDPVHAPVSPVRLTLEQARNAALAAWAHSGLSGRDVDLLAPVDPESSSTVPPASAVLAAYVKVAKTPGAKLARRIMGPQDWKTFQSIVFPSPVLVLFESDLAVTALADTATSAASAESAALTDAAPMAATAQVGQAVPSAGACSLLLDFVNDTIKTVFAAIPRIKAPAAGKVTGIFGSFLGGIINAAVGLAVGVVNGLIDGVQKIVVGAVEFLVQPVLDFIAGVAAVVATVATVVTTLQPWTGRIKAAPYPTRKAVGSENPIPGDFTLTVQTVGITPDEWPQDIADCANRAGVPLPPLRPQDATVTWALQDQTPAGLATSTSASMTTLAKDSTAKLEFATTTESAELAKKGTIQYGAVRVVATVKRDGLEQLRDKLVNLLFAQIPDVLEPIVGAPLKALLTPKINAALAGITTLQDVKTEGFEYVAYHDPKSEKPGAGKGARWRLDSPSRYSGGPSHVVIDAHTCGSISGPWQATIHITHSPANPGDPPLDTTVKFSWSFDGDGRARPTIGPYDDTVYGTKHTIIYYPLVQLNKDKGTITVVSLEGSEDGGNRIDVTEGLARVKEAVPLEPGPQQGC